MNKIRNTKILVWACNSILILGMLGCAFRPLRPGIGTINLPGVTSTVQQSENPKTESTQHYEKITDGGKTTEKLETKIGASQKDTAREVAAKLSSLKGIVWIGVLLFVAGVASAVWPPLKVIVGSLTTSVVCAIAGVALIILPTLIVGNEILILSVTGGTVAIWFFAHRHGTARGELKTLKRD